MFRYDRPQAGRYRQFWQFDIEAIGDPGPAVDAEIIELGLRFYADAGLAGVRGPAQLDRRQRLPAGLRRGADRLLPGPGRGAAGARSGDRLERNALRLLDSKDPAMAAINADAPRIIDRLCDACAAHFAAVRAHLDAMGVTYRLEPGLVRGLDYYTRTAFEFYVARSRGPAAGARRGRPLRRPRRAARRPTDAGHRVRDRARPPHPRAGRAGRRGHAAADDAPTAVVVGADPEATAERLRIATTLRAAGRRGARGARAPEAGQAARGGRAATRPTSRSSSATSSRTARSRSRTCRPGRRSSSASTTSPARSPGRTPPTGTGDRRVADTLGVAAASGDS